MLVFGQRIRSFHPSVGFVRGVGVFAQNVLDQRRVLLEYPGVIKIHGTANGVQHFIVVQGSQLSIVVFQQIFQHGVIVHGRRRRTAQETRVFVIKPFQQRIIIHAVLRRGFERV